MDIIKTMNKIENTYEKLNLDVQLKAERWDDDRVIYKARPKKSTKIAQIKSCFEDVKVRMDKSKYNMELREVNNQWYIIVSLKNVAQVHFSDVLLDSVCRDMRRKCKLPYVVGKNEEGEFVVVDFAEITHILIGGSSSSGKTVGLKEFIACLLLKKIDLILMDVATGSFDVFEGAPQLSCPIVDDKEKAYRVFELLNAEMKRRVELKRKNIEAYNRLKHIVVVVDEFQALVEGTGEKVKALTETISGILQRGRHAKIHLVLAAQNPTLKNMKIDLSNIVCRIAFKCAKQNYSMTIIGEPGAETLRGKGEMYFKSYNMNDKMKIQGVNILDEEIKSFIEKRKKHMLMNEDSPKFIISENDLNRIENKDDFEIYGGNVKKKRNDNKLGDIILWVLGSDTVSTNAIKNTFGMGWDRASKYMEMLTELGLIEDLEFKLPRKVYPLTIDDIKENVIGILKSSGHTLDEINEVFSKRNNISQPTNVSEPQKELVRSHEENGQCEGQDGMKTNPQLTNCSWLKNIERPAKRAKVRIKIDDNVQRGNIKNIKFRKKGMQSRKLNEKNE